MAKSSEKAKEIIEAIERGDNVENVKNLVSTSLDDWNRFSAKAYHQLLQQGKVKRRKLETKPHVSVTTNKQVEDILSLNNIIADFALLLPIFSTSSDLNVVCNLSKNLPDSESQILKLIGEITMHPKVRVMQKRGRIEKFEHFNKFTKLIDAATLSYYRSNFVSCYLTLAPIIEGIIIRWMGYSIGDAKPKFEEIRKFFKNAPQRQPCPFNIAFHDIYVKACDKILNQHFYKPSTRGTFYANFNRHVAAHLLNDDQFATKENCIRLFLLLDSMTEIYLCESRISDPRFYLRNDDMSEEIILLGNIILDNLNTNAEHVLLG